MKEVLKQYLARARGLTVMDFGAKTKDPAERLSDFAQPAAQAVGDGGRAELGLLCCTSGRGHLHRRQQSFRRFAPGQARRRRRRQLDAPTQ